MLLSVAIRRSIALYPKQGATWDCCALGLAAKVAGLKEGECPIDFVVKKWGLEETIGADGLRHEIELMNIYRHNTNGENRLQIADYVEQWERKHGLWKESASDWATRKVAEVTRVEVTA